MENLLYRYYEYERLAGHLLLELETFVLVFIVKFILLDLHTFERLDAQLDLGRKALDVPRALADEIRKFVLHHAKHTLLEACMLAACLSVFAAVLLVIFGDIWDCWTRESVRNRCLRQRRILGSWRGNVRAGNWDVGRHFFEERKEEKDFE
jgi:hypothetical protein